MKFIRKNLVFLLIAVLGFGGLIYLLLQKSQTSSSLKAQMERLEKMSKGLDTIKRKNWKLNEENLKVSLNNSRLMADTQVKFRKEMAERYRMTVVYPEEPQVAYRQLQDEVRKLRRFLADNEVSIPQALEHLTFSKYVLTTRPPATEDIPKIFRQLEVVRLVLNILVKSGVKQITNIARPGGLEIRTTDDYTESPIEICFVAKSETAQEFINLMSSQEKHLFTLRALQMDAPDHVAEISKDLEGAGNRNVSFGNTDEQNSSGKEARTADNSEQGGGELVELPPRRQDRLAFLSKQSAWKLRYDLIDFPLPKEKPAEQQSEATAEE